MSVNNLRDKVAELSLLRDQLEDYISWFEIPEYRHMIDIDETELAIYNLFKDLAEELLP